MQKVNLFIIGAAKSGTTALYHYLNQHPDIYMCPVKEPHFFADVESSLKNKHEKPIPGKLYHTKVIRDENTYHSLFNQAEHHKYLGEASPSYLWDKNSAKRIYQYNPEAKIIAILRDPVERAYSHYRMAYELGLEDEKDFYTALKREHSKKKKCVWGKDHLYIELGFYFKQLLRYSSIFPKKQIKIINSEFLKTDTFECYNDILVFLNLNNIKRENIIFKEKNIAQKVRYDWIRKLRVSKLRFFFKMLFGNKILSIIKNYFYIEDPKSGNRMSQKSGSYLRNVYKTDLHKLNEKFDINFK